MDEFDLGDDVPMGNRSRACSKFMVDGHENLLDNEGSDRPRKGSFEQQGDAMDAMMVLQPPGLMPMVSQQSLQVNQFGGSMGTQFPHF